MKFSVASVAVILGGTQAVLGALTIPGIITLDLGNGNGLKLDVLGGLISANIGNRNRPAPMPSTPPAAFY
ncbi:hypothetical protein IWW56_002118 [Coemansia sp. RSA 2131]|nr:hypothetical protein IWW56_002118 [Coemansia sp. RSA 2131]